MKSTSKMVFCLSFLMLILASCAGPRKKSKPPQVWPQPSPQERELLKWSAKGEKEKLAQLVNKGVDIDVQNPMGASPLMTAAYRGHLNVVRFLVESGAQLELRDGIGLTALHYAINKERYLVSEYLLTSGSQVNSKDNEGFTPLMKAARLSNPNFVRLFLKHGAQPNKQAVEGWAALHFAAAKDNPKVVRALIKSGAKVDLTDSSGETPLMIAALYDSENAAKVLLAHMSSKVTEKNVMWTDYKNRMNQTTWDVACKNGAKEVMSLLLKSYNKSLKDRDACPKRSVIKTQ